MALGIGRCCRVERQIVRVGLMGLGPSEVLRNSRVEHPRSFRRWISARTFVSLPHAPGDASEGDTGSTAARFSRKGGLLGEPGIARNLLGVLRAYEAGRWSICGELAERVGTNEEALVSKYADAVKWATKIIDPTDLRGDDSFWEVAAPPNLPFSNSR